MTIALGLLAEGGVAVGADTQETTGTSKISTRKIFTRVETGRRGYAATGAGNSGYLDAMAQEFAEEFESARSLPAARQGIRKRSIAFYGTHLLPMQVIPDRDARPDAKLIVGMTWKGSDPLLLATDDSALHFEKYYAATGTGSDFARYLLSRLVPIKHDLSLELAGMIAAFVIFKVKQYDPSCGLGTHVTMLRDGNATYFTEQTIRLMEENFRQYEQVESTVANYLIGRTLKNEDAAATALIARLRNLREQSQAIRSTPPEVDWDLDWADQGRLEPATGWTRSVTGRALITPKPAPTRPTEK